MLGINCLLRNKQIIDDLRDIVEATAYELAGNGVMPTIEAVYRGVRKIGLEVDIQTLSHIYENQFDLTDPMFSSLSDVEDAREQTIRDLMDLEAEELRYREIGRDNPVVAVIEKLMSGLKLAAGRSSSVQKIMQDRLAKAARKAMKYQTEKADAMSTEELIREVLMTEENNPFAGIGMMENAEVLWAEFKKEFESVANVLEKKGDVFNAEKIRQYADILQQSTYKFLMSTAETQQVLRDTLRDAGYTKTIDSQDGPKEVIDWNRVTTSNIDFTRTIKEVFSEKGFTDAQISRIQENFVDEFQSMIAAKKMSALNVKNKDSKAAPKRNAVKRLHTLSQLGIFQNANQNALFRLLGVNQVTQARMNTLNNMMNLYNTAMQHPMAEWSSTYVRTLEREIENLIENSEEDKSLMLNIVRKWGFYNQLNNAWLLSNPANALENITSGMFQFLMTSLTSKKEVMNSMGIVAKVFSDVVMGGVREGQELYNSFNNSSNLEDRYNFETAKTVPQKIGAFMAFVPRLILSSVDNSFKAGMVHQMGLNALRRIMIRQGVSKEDANVIINEGFYGNKDEINDVAKQLEDILVASGIKSWKGKWKRMAAEMAWSNLLTDGTFFHDLIENLKIQGRVDPNLNLTINANMLQAVRNAAESAAGKGLGHQSDSVILGMLDWMSQYLGRRVTEARSSGESSALISAEAFRTVYSNVNRYRPGSLRWLWLSIEKASGFALLQTLITDVMFNKFTGRAKAYDFNKIDLSDNNKQLERDIDRYMSLRQRLVRETIAPIFAYAIGNVVLAKAVEHLKLDDEDEEEGLVELAKWMVSDYTNQRWMQKILPPRTYAYLSSLAWVDKGKVKSLKPSEVKLHSKMFPFAITSLEELKAEANNVFRVAKNNFSESSINELFTKFERYDYGKGDVGIPIGQFLGKSMNLFGPLRTFQTFKDSFRENPIKSTKEYNKIKPEDFWDGFYKETFGRDIYENMKLNE